MKSIFSLFILFNSLANAAVADFMQAGLSDVQSTLKDSFKTDLNSAGGCPDPGSETFANLYEKKGKILSAAATVQTVIKLTDPKTSELMTDNLKCGSCSQVNIVSQFAAVNPDETIDDPQCADRPKETFTETFDSAQDLQRYTQDILQAKSDDGKRLAQNCPDPCAYYITTAQTPLTAGKTHLTLAVQCGNPRKKGILASVYSYKAGVIHNWSCIKN